MEYDKIIIIFTLLGPEKCEWKNLSGLIFAVLIQGLWYARYVHIPKRYSLYSLEYTKVPSLFAGLMTPFPHPHLSSKFWWGNLSEKI